MRHFEKDYERNTAIEAISIVSAMCAAYCDDPGEKSTIFSFIAEILRMIGQDLVEVE